MTATENNQVGGARRKWRWISVAAVAFSILAVASAFGAGQTPTPAWQTVFELENESLAAVEALTQDAEGNLYAAVSICPAPGETRRRAVIRKSCDQGATWRVIEDLLAPPKCAIRFLGLGVDATGHLYAVGYVTDQNDQERWIVRKRCAGGTSWATVDEFAGPSGRTAVAQGFAADPEGNLYVAGYAAEGAQGQKWIVRTSADAGWTWSTIDDFTYTSKARAAAILSTPNGLFVAGSGRDPGTESGEVWLVRKGVKDKTGAFQWKTVDEFQMQKGRTLVLCGAHALAVDGQGNLYSVGRSCALANHCCSVHWVVRRASPEGREWTVVDTFQLSPGCLATANGIAAAGSAGMFVVGQAADRNSRLRWIVRQSATGDAGSWTVSDHFVLPAAPAPPRADFVSELCYGSTPPLGLSRGLAISAAAPYVFTAGSAGVGMSDNAVVRRLELGGESDAGVSR